MKKPIIFCDFDGTVTDNDNIISLMKQFAPPEWVPIKDRVLNQTITIQDGVSRMFSLIESDKKKEMIHFLKKTAAIREGFQEFLEFAENRSIPFYIVSGGMDFFVEPLLDPYGPIKEIYCNQASFKGEFVEIKWPYPCDKECQNGCGCCKPTIIRSLSREEHFTIVIGDSITDLEAAKQADLVLARDFLSKACEKQGIRYIPFETFFDCRAILEQNLEVV
ncbi:2-hydroxy-3-keto-5-methylthiopentenyl-1-phosphate phosphatase [Heyndrickxia acidicola]|uniref:2-hydroxy-3-keto-5-methylthiopentenyl-1-phosphate phosphatase n=1 Tax=Heyndrickxia acidicola TaxID=209389 RepID=A0ABU6MHZ1_9BACI|nr:2-hydroxy-3-keto-5-methylthiopentenyl-1-phosphate phosphatase [Heyndrickxia acidicola]MED1204286.1 2-hydroxy-3-keto-5-methylthiopentenyl-1-phosphate phosphatase [Heyndrickxia acidicola]